MEDKKLNAGRVGLTMKGAWNASQSYEKLNCVSHNGRSWAAKKNVSAGVEPSAANSEFWQMMSDRGVQGIQGPVGPQGNSAFDGIGVEIVNNLTQGGESAVLSAEQGKVLKTELTELESELEQTAVDLKVEIGENIPINLYNALFVTTNMTNWDVENGSDYFIITHNNTFSTGSPYAGIQLPSGTYVLRADFSQSTQKYIELYVDGSWVKNVGNGQSFEIDSAKVNNFRFAPTTQGTWKVSDIRLTNTDAVNVKEMQQKVSNVGQLVSRNSFVGIGDTYTSVLMTGLKPGGKYRCYIHNQNWKRDGISLGGNFGFNIAAEVNGQFVDLIIRTTLELSTLAAFYDFVIPSNSNGTIRIGGRADIGEEVHFSVIDITDSLMQDSGEMALIGNVVPLSVFDARTFVTANTTNWTLTLLKDYIRVTHNNSYTTGSPYAPLDLQEGEYLFTADFSEAPAQKYINLYKNDVWYKNLTNGVIFEIETGASYSLGYAPTKEGTSIVKNISIVKADRLPLDINVDEALLTQHCTNLNKDADVDSFLFFTDPHLLNEGLIDFKRSIYIQTIKAYADNLPVKNVICGGDWINHFDNIEDAARCLGYINGFMTSTFANYQPIVGNHEYNKYIEGQEALSIKAIRNLYSNREKNYYSFDSALSRFIVFDSGIDIYNHLMDEYKWEQIEWLANLLKENVEHNVIMLHISYVEDSASALLNNITLMTKAYNTRSSVTLNGMTYNFGDASGKVHCVISGHTHEDATHVLNDMPVIITADLRNGNIPTFDLFAVNYGESKAYITRVGNGESRVVEIVA